MSRRQPVIHRNPKRDRTADLPATLLCIPARDEADELASLMLAQLLNRRGLGGHVLSAGTLVAESLDAVTRENPLVACVVAVPPFGYVHARYLCRRLKAHHPNLRIVGAILTEQPMEELKQRRPALAADELAPSLQLAVAQVLSLAPTQPRCRNQPARGYECGSAASVS